MVLLGEGDAMSPAIKFATDAVGTYVNAAAIRTLVYSRFINRISNSHEHCLKPTAQFVITGNTRMIHNGSAPPPTLSSTLRNHL